MGGTGDVRAWRLPDDELDNDDGVGADHDGDREEEHEYTLNRQKHWLLRYHLGYTPRNIGYLDTILGIHRETLVT